MTRFPAPEQPVAVFAPAPARLRVGFIIEATDVVVKLVVVVSSSHSVVAAEVAGAANIGLAFDPPHYAAVDAIPPARLRVGGSCVRGPGEDGHRAYCGHPRPGKQSAPQHAASADPVEGPLLLIGRHACRPFALASSRPARI